MIIFVLWFSQFLFYPGTLVIYVLKTLESHIFGEQGDDNSVLFQRALNAG